MKIIEKIAFVLFVLIIAVSLFGKEIELGKYDEIVRFIMGALLGIIILGAGLFKWRFFGIRSCFRNGKYGEELNTIFMTILGIVIIICAFQILMP